MPLCYNVALVITVIGERDYSTLNSLHWDFFFWTESHSYHRIAPTNGLAGTMATTTAKARRWRLLSHEVANGILPVLIEFGGSADAASTLAIGQSNK